MEYTIIFPLVVIVIFAVLYTGYIMHQKGTMQAAVQRGAIKAARIYADPGYEHIVQESPKGQKDRVDIAGVNSLLTTPAFDDIQPYRYVFGNEGSLDSVVDDVSGYIQKTQLFGKENVDVEISCQNKIFYRKVVVTAEQKFNLPFLFGNLGLPPFLTIKAEAVSIVNDTDEFIRNADLVVDVIAEVSEKTGLDQKIEGIFKKAKDMMDKFFK